MAKVGWIRIEEKVVFREELRKRRGRKTEGLEEIGEGDLFSVMRCRWMRNGGEVVS